MKAVFIHGYGCWSGDWEACIALLSDEIDCVAVDLAGHGERHTDSGPFTLGRAAREVGGSLTGEPVILVGHSMGTRIAVQTAVLFPEAVQAIVLVDGSCVPVPLGIEPVDVALHGLTAEQHKDVVRRAEALSPAAAEGYLNDMTRWDREEAAGHIAAVTCPVHLLQSTNYTRPPDCRRLFIRDQPDSLWFDLWRDHPRCQVERLDNAGHYLPLERPAEVARMVRAAAG